MCKLCRKSSPKLSQIRRRAQKEFIQIANDYTGENPCSNCCTGYSNRTHEDMSVDTFIVRKLLRAYRKDVLTNKQYNAAYKMFEKKQRKENAKEKSD